MTFSLQNFSISEVALSVAGLTDYIQALLEQDDQLRQVWVVGEVSSTNPHRSGLFFMLQDPEGAAAINCVVWQSTLDQLATLPVPGEQVIVLGSIRLYAKRGSYRLTVWQVLPAGEGLQALRYRQLRQRLEAEGLFDADRKQALPSYPQTVAVVTSPQAAAWGDIQRTFSHRHPGLKVLFSPAIVQGEQAPASIAQAIARVVQDGRAEVILVARGGGATEDLSCFNDERVVRAIAMCPIPVITGIGHERDESLADWVADVCAHTPTAAAERAVPCLADLDADHERRIEALQEAVNQALRTEEDRLQYLHARLQQFHLDRQIYQAEQAIAQRRQRLLRAVGQRLQQAEQQCQFLQEKLATLDPAAVLRRGYAVIRQSNGAIVRSAQDLKPDQVLTVQLAQGQVQVKVMQPQTSDSQDL